MKKLLFLFSLIYPLTDLFGQEQHGFNIIGKIDGLPDGTLFYLITNKPNGAADTILSVKSKNQHFLFRGVVPLEAQLYFVKMDTTILKLKQEELGRKRQSWVRLLLDNSIAYLTGHLEHWPKVHIRGSIPTDEHDKFVATISSSVTDFNREIKASKNDSNRIVQAIMRYNQSYIKALEVIPDSYAIPLFIINNGRLPLDAKEITYSKLSKKNKNSFYGLKLKEIITSQRAGESIMVGKILPDFEIEMLEGEPRSIKSIIAESKFTLIDFWASWCLPCRKDIPNMKKVYEAFNDQGFNIISISIDKKFESWRKALTEEDMPWINGLEQNEVSRKLFDIATIPAQILVNNHAEIIAVDYTRSGSTLANRIRQKLRGEDLFNVVENLIVPQ